MSRVAWLFDKGGRAMSCPPDPVLLLHDAGELPPDLAEGWSAPSLQEHIASCRRCRRAIAGWERSLDSFRDLDVVDTSTYDDVFFDDLAKEIDAALGVPERSKVVPLRRRRGLPPMVWAAAALLAVAFLLSSLRPEPTAPTVAIEAPTEDSFADEARALGRAWLDEALEEDGAEQFAWSEYDADDYPFATSLYDEFDALSDDELASLFSL